MNKQTEMEKCTTYNRKGGRCEIKCRLGLWSVEGEDLIDVVNEAYHYFEQYKDAGEYHEIIGGESPVQKIMKGET